MASFNATVDRYKAILANVDAGGPELPNENFDVAGATIAGKYKGSDEAYAKLLGKPGGPSVHRDAAGAAPG